MKRKFAKIGEPEYLRKDDLTHYTIVLENKQEVKKALEGLFSSKGKLNFVDANISVVDGPFSFSLKGDIIKVSQNGKLIAEIIIYQTTQADMSAIESEDDILVRSISITSVLNDIEETESAIIIYFEDFIPLSELGLEIQP